MKPNKEEMANWAAGDYYGAIRAYRRRTQSTADEAVMALVTANDYGKEFIQ